MSPCVATTSASSKQCAAVWQEVLGRREETVRSRKAFNSLRLDIVSGFGVWVGGNPYKTYVEPESI